MFVRRERLKSESELKSVSCGNTFQIRITLSYFEHFLPKHSHTKKPL